MPTRVVLTYGDYAALPADGRRYELHDGELSVTAAPAPDHQHVVLELAVVLREFVNERRLGKIFISPIDCILSDITVVEPDIVYLASDRLSAVSGRGIEGQLYLTRDRRVSCPPSTRSSVPCASSTARC